MRLMLPEGSGDNLAPILEAFTRLSGVAVETTVTHVDDINTRLTEDALLSSGAHDVALPATFGLPDLIHLGVVQPMDPFLERYPDLYDPAGHLYTHGDVFRDQHFGFQTDGDVYLLFFHDDLLRDPEEMAAFEDRHGRTLATPQTWGEFDEMMAFFNRPEDDIWGGLLFRQAGYVGWEYISRLQAEGVPLFGEGMVPTFQSDAAIKVIEDMIRSGASQHPRSLTAGLFENWQIYKENTILANIGWGGSQKSFQQEGSPLRGKLSHAPLPKGAGSGNGYFNWGWSFVLPQSAQQPELGFLLSVLAMTPEISTLAVEQVGGFFDPFHESHYRSPKVREVYGDSFLREHEAAMRAAGPDLYIPGHGNYMAGLNEHVFSAISGAARPEDALKRLQLEWETVTFEFGRAEQARFYSRVR
ncbi:extracellular solute-binding protein [Poseidonocella sedimentorum]|uniref:extracellular solute-binding protein n=1 Tax=Poseidonocella sedimentorum TaxID=871652 RepID=UPI0015A61B9C